jgi:hypothetical protein
MCFSRFGRAAVLADASLRLGMVRREAGNEDAFSLPVALQVQAFPRVVVQLSSGLYGELTSFPRGAEMPLAIGASAALSPAFDLGARFGFPGLLGREAEGIEDREVSLFVAYRL